MVGFLGMENVNMFTAAGDENKTDAKLAEIREFAKPL